MIDEFATLHSKAPVWRALFWAALAVTVSALLTSGTPSPTATPPPPSPVAGSVPSSGPITPVAPAPMPPAEAMNRLRAFSNEVQAARSEAREGARCERIVAAFASVRQEDHAHATGALANARDEGLACRARIGQSDARLAELDVRARAFAANRTPINAEVAARSRTALTAFDRSRVEMDRFLEADRTAESAAAALAQSDTRIADFNAAYSAWRSDRANGTPAERRLMGATQALTSFDRDRLSPAQGGAVTDAADLAADLAGSDRRLDELTAALAAARADPGASANRLLDAYGELGGPDRRRADNQQRATIDAAANLARGLALSRLIERSTAFRTDTNNPAVVVALVRLQPALAGIDPLTLTPEQRDALPDIDRAAGQIRDSDRRIATLERALQSFQSSRSRLTGDALLQALDNVSEFDRRRLTAPQTEMLERAAVAGSMVRAPQVPRERWANEVSVFVASPPGNDGPMIAERIQRALTAAGFRVVLRREVAGLVVDVQSPQVGRPELFQVGSLENVRITAVVSARLLWGIDGTSAGPGLQRTAPGIGMAEGDARRNALHEAAERLAESSAMALR